MTGLAALSMYDLSAARAAANGLWSAIAARLENAPPSLTWDGDVRAQWRSPELVLGQTCGWPLITELRERATVVGAFHYDIDRDIDHDNADAPMYRSVLVATEGRPVASFAGSVGAVSEWDSLSGCVSLGVAVAECDGPTPFFGRLIETGSHRGSVEAVRAGVAELASIDAVTWALFERYLPEVVGGLEVVGCGPEVPTLPLITAMSDPEPLRIAIESAVADPATAPFRDRLLVTGFSRMDLESYRGIEPLGEIANTALGR